MPLVKMGRTAMHTRLEALLQATLREPLVFDLGVDLAVPSAQGVVGFVAHLRALLGAGALGRGVRAEQAEQAESHLLTSESVAARYGFLHLGHVAAHYRQRFIESPSQTLQGSRPAP